MKVKEGADLVSLCPKALEEIDVGFHPGVNYSPDGKSGGNYLRLCYGYNEPEEIGEGITRLAEFFEKEGVLDS